jgi:DNA-binding CsgD family transcriptional regulator
VQSNGHNLSFQTQSVGAGPRVADDASAYTDCVDSYDDDLTWIADKLATRVGADFGIICRYLAMEAEGSAIALGAGFAAPEAGFLARIIAAVGSTVAPSERSAGDQPEINEQGVNNPSGEESYRLLSMFFSPSPSVHIVAVVLRRGADSAFTSMQRSIATMYYPVLSRYVRLWWMHREERSRAAAFRAALDISDVGIILLDRKLELMFENARASTLLKRGCGIRRHGKYVAAETSNDGMKLQAALQHSLNYNLSRLRSPGRQPAPLLTLRRNDGQRSLIVTVLGLKQLAVDARDAAVIVHVIDPSRDFSKLIAPLCNIYRLTVTETRLTYLLTSGLPLAGAAEKMKVQEATARSYLKQIFTKTFTNRQADLVRLMLSSLQHINPGIELEPH